MLESLIGSKKSTSNSVRHFIARLVIDFYLEGGETVIDVANPQDNYSLYTESGITEPLSNALSSGKHYECVNPGNTERTNEIGIQFHKLDGLSSESVNNLIENLATTSNMYMVVMGMAQILTYGSQDRLSNLKIDWSTEDEMDKRMIELFARRVSKMDVKYLILSDGIKEGGNIDRQNIPENKWKLLADELTKSGWSITKETLDSNLVILGER